MPDHIYVYPAYLLKDGSRADGRRVAAAHAPSSATVEQIVAAAKSLGFQAVAEPDRGYPRRGSAEVGRVKVTKRSGVTKTKLLRLLADEVRKSGGPTPR
ncbi:MAG: signal recognition particle subunit SRP19/SEC65 family protein [Thermoplasmata archaeon]|nr:signal recognition particle subunit SRP19/SEC65 family protein [Thermoplasmata archaeon]